MAQQTGCYIKKERCEAVCWSCLEADNLRNMHQAYPFNGKDEIYADMLSYCFSIQIERHDPEPGFFICAVCIVRLREAVDFRMSIENSRRTFLHPKVEIDVKCTGNDGLAQDVEFLEMLEDTEDLVVGNNQGENLAARAISVLPSLPEIKTRGKRRNERTQKRNGKKLKKITGKESQKSSEAAIILEKLSKEERKKYILEQRRARRRATYRVWSKNLLPYELDGTELQCKICQETFFYHKALKIHMTVHFPNIQCEVCSKWFTTKLQLKKHMDSHKAPMACPVCEQIFKITTLKRHLRKFHPEYSQLKCEQCNLKFLSYVALFKHMEEEHGRESDKNEDDTEDASYVCNICSESFNCSSSLWNHTQVVHLKTISSKV